MRILDSLKFFFHQNTQVKVFNTDFFGRITVNNAFVTVKTAATHLYDLKESNYMKLFCKGEEENRSRTDIVL